jgi:hypothetical protein
MSSLSIANAGALGVAGFYPGPTSRSRIRMSGWLICILLSVCFAPTVELSRVISGAGAVPLRLEDFFAIGALVYLLISRPTMRAGQTSGAEWILLATALYVLADTFAGSPIPGTTIQLKEYLDVLRILKFLVVFAVASRSTPEDYQRLLAWLPAIAALFAVLAIGQYFLDHGSDNLLARFSLSYGRMEELRFRHYLGYRPFATFSSPTDFGYFMSVVLILAVLLKNLPHRKLTILTSLVGLTLSGTRTFLFSIPVLLVIYVLFFGGNVQHRTRTLFFAIIAGILSILLLRYFFSTYTDEITMTLNRLLFGGIENDESYRYRSNNLDLVRLTLEHAPMTGVISREFFPNAVDSEYIMTLHRYGVIGLVFTALLYGGLVTQVLRHIRRFPIQGRVALWIITLTAIYGVTQGALINTRMGCVPFLLLGMFISHCRAPRSGAAAAGPEIRVVAGNA